MAELIKQAQPLISIVMPVKNGEKFIGASICSVIAQTYQNWELIIVNDHSSDNTRQLVREYMVSEKRIRLITLKGRKTGAAYSRRCAVNMASGEWIAFLDSDDTWSPDKLMIQMRFAEKKNCRFVFTASSFLNEDGSVKKYVFHIPGKIGFPEILKQDIISCSSVLIKKELLADSFYETSNDICDDYAAWIRILRDNSETAYGIDLPLLRYRISRTSLSFNKFQSAYRTYLTHRHVGLAFPKTAYYFCWYVLRSLKKYTGIYFDRRTEK